MPTELILVVGALIIIFLVLRAFFDIIKAVIGTVVGIFAIVVILNFFNISPQDLMQQINILLKNFDPLINGLRKIIGV